MTKTKDFVSNVALVMAAGDTEDKMQEVLSEKEAVDLADKFPEWVSELLQESASGARETISWFIKTLYAKGYEIRKKK